MSSRPARRDDNAADSIAIVGIGCRYADARGPEQFWDIVRSGRNTVRDVPEHRVALGYDIDHFFDPRPRIPGKISSKKGGFLEHPELFDPKAFGIAPRDALTMEPQQRLMVEVTWDALEDAGIVPEQIAGERVAVILGYMAEDYSRERAGVLGEAAVYRGHDVFTVGGMSHAVLSGRIAFLLGVTGPSFTLDTACSSSLIATHLACQSLRRGESDMALAGGVNLFLSPEGNIALSRSGMLSMSGACKAFDASADGFVRAEGAGVVVLKRLSDAVADDDPIYAVIRGSGISTDGRDGGHMMAPGRGGQAQAMRDAYAEAGIDPSRVQYVETHGTGTMIGDPVEIGALADVMGPGRDPEHPLRVASVKGNLGHTESASGVAGLIKACLSIKHRTLPAQVHFETPSPSIPWDEIPVRVQSETTPWPVDGPALVGVNSFGISGTNAHIVLEGPPERGMDSIAGSRTAAERDAARPLVLPITAHDSAALHDMVVATRERLRDLTQRETEDLVFTFARRRSHHTHRIAFIADSRRALERELDAYLAGEATPSVVTGIAPAESVQRVVMVFPGQGSQWSGMARDLIATEPTFAASIDRLDQAYAAHVDWSLSAVLVGETDFDLNDRLDVLQPVLVAVEVALAELWIHFGVRPSRVLGQSMGEIAAAYIAGMLDLDDMSRLVTHRGRVVAQASGDGAMAVVSLSREDTEDRLTGRVHEIEIAGVNSPRTTIVSGDSAAVAGFVVGLEGEGVFARRLDVDFASHCFHMDPLVEPFRRGIEGLAPRPGKVPFHSTADGESSAGEDLGADYWVRNLRSPVAFDQGLASVLAEDESLFLEVSPHPSLPRAIDETARAFGTDAAYVPSLVRNESEPLSFARHFAALFVAGAEVDWSKFGPVGHVTSLPLYAYQRERYWFSERSRIDNFRAVHPFLTAASDSSIDPDLRTWDFVFDVDSAGFVSGCRSGSDIIAPTGLFLELALAAGDATWPGIGCEVGDLQVQRQLEIETDGRAQVQVVLRRDEDGGGALSVSSRLIGDVEWCLNASCALSLTNDGRSNESRAEVIAEVAVPLATTDVDRALERCGQTLSGPARTLREIGRAEPDERGRRRLVAKLMLPRSVESEWYAYHVHPALIEGALQAASQLLDDPRALSILGIEEVALSGGLGSDCLVQVTERLPPSTTAGGTVFDLAFFDRDGECLGGLSGVRASPRAVTSMAEPTASDVLGFTWHELPNVTEVSADRAARWVIISDDEVEAELVAAELRKRGEECWFCEKPEDMGPLGARMRAGDARRWGILIVAWGRRPREAATEPQLHREFRIGSWAAVLREHATDVPEVWIATRGLVEIEAGPTRTTIVGARMAQEIDAFTNSVELDRCRFFDVCSDVTPIERRQLAETVGLSSPNRCYAVRGGSVFSLRLAPAQTKASSLLRSQPAGSANFTLERTLEDGRSGAASLRRAPTEPLASGMIRVDVRAAGLSDVDVLTDLGLVEPLRGPGGHFGQGFAGIVTELGTGTENFEIGQRIVGLVEGAVARSLVVDARRAVPISTGAGFEAAAGRVFPMIIARFALDDVASLQSQERVLVDLEPGALREAVIERAQACGATIEAASRDGARGEAGVALLSRSEPGQESMQFDVIVASRLTGERPRQINSLSRRGRYVELKSGGSQASFEGLGAFLGSNRSYSVVDAAELLQEDPQWLGASLLEVRSDLASSPTSEPCGVTFPITEASRALRYLGQGRARNYVSLSIEDGSAVQLEPEGTSGVPLESVGRILLSGSAGAPYVGNLADALASAGAPDVEVVADKSIEELVECADAAALWIHAVDEASRDRAVIRHAMTSSRCLVNLFLATRAPTTGEALRDREWESLIWTDALGGAAPRVLDVSVSARSVPDSLLQLITAAVSGSAPDSPVVLMDEAEQHKRSASPLVAELVAAAGTACVAVRPDELATMSPPERRRAMIGVVQGELAAVLGMEDTQRESLEAASSLDRVGLDSLMTLELFMGLSRQLELEIGPTWFDSIPTIGEIAEVLGDRIVSRSLGKSS